MENQNDKCSIKLKDVGLKVTKQREIIINLLSEANGPMSVDDIYLKLKQQGFNINLSTIYRNLDTLVSKELVTSMNFGENINKLYEYNRREHKHYFICLKCKKVTPISGCPIDNYETNFEKNLVIIF